MCAHRCSNPECDCQPVTCPDCDERTFDPATDSYPLPDVCSHAYPVASIALTDALDRPAEPKPKLAKLLSDPSVLDG